MMTNAQPRINTLELDCWRGLYIMYETVVNNRMKDHVSFVSATYLIILIILLYGLNIFSINTVLVLNHPDKSIFRRFEIPVEAG